ncbi:helix-turn-helix protein [Krasilnikovia cinnamomea]|uniref:Helix-turn-helix protein n=1 Tax=Krasilnikovia cinnamomea TaxID=349313 RepID=A0A4V2G6G8_9ACTN|nr:helix-turn-helix transcriptional regulator [Krasilnikovia cinnamomea]RZU48636.1 helix-turn-helix protein [Krasilnikovia cinnamomea]
MDGPAPAFGELLRQLRLARGLSLRAFQPLTNHSKSLIGDWETGRKVPTSDIAKRLDHLLDAGGRLAAAAAATRPPNAPDRIASEVVRHFAHQGPVADEIRRRAEVAGQVDVLAIRGLGILGLNDSLLRPTLARRGCPLKARILLLEPGCEAAATRAGEIGENPAAFASGIKFTLARLEELTASAENLDLTVSLYSSQPIWRTIRVDDVLWVSSFAPGWEGHESTIYEIPKTPRGSFWSGYCKQFDEMSAHARRVI